MSLNPLTAGWGVARVTGESLILRTLILRMCVKPNLMAGFKVLQQQTQQFRLKQICCWCWCWGWRWRRTSIFIFICSITRADLVLKFSRISGTDDQINLNDKSIAWMPHDVGMRSGVLNDPRGAKWRSWIAN